MANLNIGCDFSQEHVDAIGQLYIESEVNDWPSQIGGVYGSPRIGNPFGSVRRSFRETEASSNAFFERAILLHQDNIDVNLTFNSLFPHLKGTGLSANIFDNKKAMDALKYFVDSAHGYVDNWIISHPHVVDLFHSEFPDEEIIISTIMNVHSLPQLHWIKEKWPNVIRVSPALWRNREHKWLREANKIIPLELIVNEFCSIGGVSCEGLYRQACYVSQSLEIKDWNPMLARCIQGRKDNPEAWLMARFILPQWLYDYTSSTGVKHFKITGRTHSVEYINYIGEMYCKEKATGNLLELWGQLEATLHKEDWSEEQKKAVSTINIPIEKIEHLVNQFVSCEEDICGVSCNICKQFVNSILGIGK